MTVTTRPQWALGFWILLWAVVGCDGAPPTPALFLGDQSGCLGQSPDGKCPQIVYVTDTRMPLSIDGVREARTAAHTIGLEFRQIAVDSLRARAERGIGIAGALLKRGALLHLPSVFLVASSGDAILGPVFGYKTERGYRAALGRLLTTDSVWSPVSFSASRARPPTDSLTEVWTTTLSGRVGLFFRHLPSSPIVTLDEGGRTYLLNVETGRRRVGPGRLDLVPSPDGLFMVTPGGPEVGLEFHLVKDIMRSDSLSRIVPSYADTLMADQYPSIGIVEEGSESSIYRVLVSWYKGAKIRDYRIGVDARGTLTVVPASPARVACPSWTLSTPILSRSGRLISARDEASGTSRVFEIDIEGSCLPVIDLDATTSKATFSPGDSLVAYTTARPGAGHEVVVVGLDDGKPRYRTRLGNATIPDFAFDRGVLVMEEAGDDQYALTLLCCTGG